jgi:uncharacterized membrane protein YpjA
VSQGKPFLGEINIIAIAHVTKKKYGLWLMVIHATFKNISVTGISWLSVLLVEETGVPRENHRPVASH